MASLHCNTSGGSEATCQSDADLGIHSHVFGCGFPVIQFLCVDRKNNGLVNGSSFQNLCCKYGSSSQHHCSSYDTCISILLRPTCSSVHRQWKRNFNATADWCRTGDLYHCHDSSCHCREEAIAADQNSWVAEQPNCTSTYVYFLAHSTVQHSWTCSSVFLLGFAWVFLWSSSWWHAQHRLSFICIKHWNCPFLVHCHCWHCYQCKRQSIWIRSSSKLDCQQHQ